MRANRRPTRSSARRQTLAADVQLVRRQRRSVQPHAALGDQPAGLARATPASRLSASSAGT